MADSTRGAYFSPPPPPKVRKAHDRRGCRWCTHCSGAGACCVAWDTTGTPYNGADKLALMLKVFLFSDCSPEEFIAIRREDVYLDENRIWIRPAAAVKPRMIALAGCCKKELITHLNHTNSKYLFETAEHAPYRPNDLHQIVANIRRAAKNKGAVGPERLRRTIAAWFSARGVLKKEVRPFLSHGA